MRAKLEDDRTTASKKFRTRLETDYEEEKATLDAALNKLNTMMKVNKRFRDAQRSEYTDSLSNQITGLIAGRPSLSMPETLDFENPLTKQQNRNASFRACWNNRRLVRDNVGAPLTVTRALELLRDKEGVYVVGSIRDDTSEHYAKQVELKGD